LQHYADKRYSFWEMAERRRQRFESLDVVRGLASLAVVLSHWTAFYALPDGFDLHQVPLPFGRVSWLFCEYGGAAVDLFFCLSGFIFFHLYRGAIENGRVPAGDFAALRFSRLYPLHLVTLLLVCVLQAVYLRQHGTYWGDQPNNVFAFILQLGFVSDWWPNSPLTFNGPIWSVSIEVLLYILFFIAAKSLVLRVETVAAASVIGFLLIAFDIDLGRGISMFYMGGLACYLVDAIANQRVSRSLVGAIAVVAISGFVILKLGHRGLVGSVLMIFVFPAMIVTLVLLEKRIERWVRPLRWLGNVSYSTYLLHSPLFFIIILFGFPLHPDSRLFFVVVITVLLALSLASFHLFEYPAQQFLRRKLLSRLVVREPAAAR
jgi:peptidoglycan/LPS O-acetylase OafA/YrhL